MYLPIQNRQLFAGLTELCVEVGVRFEAPQLHYFSLFCL